MQFYELLTPGTSTTTRTQNSKMVPHLLFPLPLPILTPGNQPWAGPSLTVPLFVNAIHHTEMYPCSRYLQIYYNFPAHGFIILAPRPGGQADGQEGASLPAAAPSLTLLCWTKGGYHARNPSNGKVCTVLPYPLRGLLTREPDTLPWTLLNWRAPDPEASLGAKLHAVFCINVLAKLCSNRAMLPKP